MSSIPTTSTSVRSSSRFPRRTGSSGGTRALPGYVEEVERFLDHPKFLGLKLHPLIDGYHPNDPAVHPLMELLLERGGLPVLVHSGHPIFTLPWSIEELAVAFPGVQVIMGHMGHGNVVYINASIDIAARNANVYLETSGMPMHTKIKEAVDRVGVERVLYGSDAPFHHPAVEILRVQVSGLRRGAATACCARTAARSSSADETAERGGDEDIDLGIIASVQRGTTESKEEERCVDGAE